jgi:hypothetical protein
MHGRIADAIITNALGFVGIGSVLVGCLLSQSRGLGRIRDSSCATKQRLSGSILQETLSLFVLQQYPAGVDEL